MAKTPKKPAKAKQDLKTPTKDPLAAKLQLNGAMDSPARVFQYVNRKDFPYEEETLDAYKQKLAKMNVAQLQHHAIDVARILPTITDRGRLVDRLEREFLTKLGRYQVKMSQAASPNNGLTPDQANNIHNILNPK